MTTLAGWTTLTAAQIARWEELLQGLVAMLSPAPRLIVVDGHQHGQVFADRLAGAFTALGHDCARLCDHEREPAVAIGPGIGPAIVLADGPRWRAEPPTGTWDTVIWLRAAPAGPGPRLSDPPEAQVVIDLHDPGWPVIRHLDPALADRRQWYVAETRAFFAVRAATWDTRFGDDSIAYGRAVDRIGIAAGAVVLDAGCGTGRALPALRAAVGPLGTVIGVDLTAEMLDEARDRGRAEAAELVLADARFLPLRDAGVDAVFAAGLIGHLPDVEPALTELARVTRSGGRLALFHPSGRAGLAARRGRPLRPDEPLAEGPLSTATGHCGWRLDDYEDADDHFFALATRVAD